MCTFSKIQHPCDCTDFVSSQDIPTSFENWLTEGSYSSKIVPHEAFKESTGGSGLWDCMLPCFYALQHVVKFNTTALIQS